METIKKNIKEQENYNCPIAQFVHLLAGKWAIPVLYRLIIEDKPIRFGVLRRSIHPITQKELTKQLKWFEEKGLATRTVYPEMPLRVEYQITPLGKTLKPALFSLADWMLEHANQLK